MKVCVFRIKQRGRKTHAAYGVDGSPLDGFPLNYYTYCNQKLDDPDRWEELPGAEVECAVCRRRVERDEVAS